MMNVWSKHWEVGRQHEAPQWLGDLGPVFDRPSVEEARQVLRLFKSRTGVGFDSLSPRDFDALSDAGVEALLDVVMDVERNATWPELQSKVVFLAKRTGGWRPIALLCALVRFQGRLRRVLARRWESQHDRAFFWAGQGKACDRLVWHQSLLSEWARSHDYSCHRAPRPPQGV